MKKIILLICLVFILVSCNNNGINDVIDNKIEVKVDENKKVKIEEQEQNIKKEDISEIVDDNELIENIESDIVYYIENWKVFSKIWSKIIHITQKITNIWTYCKIWEVRNESMKILDYSDKYLSVIINWWICEWWGWNSVYYFNINNLSYIDDLNIFKYLEKKYWEKTFYQLLWIDWNSININVFKYLDEEELWYRNTITDNNKSIEDIIKDNSSKKFIKTDNVKLSDLFIE